jgi:hypothetical protein
MATGREHSPEDRYDLATEARTVAKAAMDESASPLEPGAVSADSVLASLATRAGVDTISPVGRQRGMKRTVLRASQVFLRDQAAFNRLAVTALEDLTARLDAAEARLAELEGQRADTESGGDR